jgi:hypothetical protein
VHQQQIRHVPPDPSRIRADQLERLRRNANNVVVEVSQ